MNKSRALEELTECISIYRWWQKLPRGNPDVEGAVCRLLAKGLFVYLTRQSMNDNWQNMGLEELYMLAQNNRHLIGEYDYV